ncbi:antibiotic acetyltransferase [Ornithinimicrobium ciconiae]|uniref:Antibiotic acetyltransferase n=1 Tax=Ornithinimicrobium ciconiae TaxID=2594265 RepID=A0A516G7D0_9MICO|nr:DapH/DapD/GlmU-related protein [Ornithinimicrobium ciconiae]QDO87428.1 antibiotic acetyltransferase [Ornithinimicrobium ciconiae]
MERYYRSVRKQVGRVRRRLTPRPEHALPPGGRLDQRPDLRDDDIGKYSWGHLTVSNRAPGCVLSIGRYCSFSYGTQVLLGGEHRADFATTYRFGVYPPFNEWFEPVPDSSVGRGDVTIGNDVWIGHQSVILSGVTLGDGVVVGAGSVVRQSAPPYALVMGNPARVAGFRFSAEQIEALLRIRWWDWSEERIVEGLPLMMSDDIQRFIDAHDIGE